jgi:diguanylate cyclase (GGDEF)-like protein/PAS domain S-box-containing protein
MIRNVLLIQDDPADAETIRGALLSSGDGPFQVVWVRRCSEALEQLRPEGQQVQPMGPRMAAILVDLLLPDSRGLETVDQLLRAAPQIPILVLCTARDEDVAKLAVQHGAQDYLLKTRVDSYLLHKALGSMIERSAIAEALFEERERAQVTLKSIGDAVVSIDARGNVTYLNIVAETMTGWSRDEAAGHSVEEVLRIVDVTTREIVPNPMALAIRENKTVDLKANCVLIRRDGVETSIEESAAPIHDRQGQVTGAVMVFHDVSMARALSLKMYHLAQHDGLTDLPNRMLLDDRLAQAITLCHRNQQKLAVLFLDLDRFKHINDTLGHDFGDRVLRNAAQRLLQCVRSSDTVSRQGGDEFVIVLSEIAHSQDAEGCAAKILSALSVPVRIDEHDLYITASIGIATYPDDGNDAETLLKHADLAMYHAKANGFNTFQFFEPGMNARAAERHLLENGLRHAIEREQFVLHYQSKINLATGAIVGVEALVRWCHPERGLILPGQFLAIAEESGLIVPIGRWVMTECCNRARAWRDAGLPPIRMAINISAVELRTKGFVSGVRAMLTQAKLEPSDLELELTETFLLQNADSTAAVLEALKDVGVRLALDDFGTGYASLSHLRRFPIDTLKIDRSFVRDIAMDSDDASIVRAVIGMGKSLDMQVVAEGVETSEQFDFLRQQGCPEGQGYYFSEPIVAAEFARNLGRHPSGQRLTAG